MGLLAHKRPGQRRVFKIINLRRELNGVSELANSSNVPLETTALERKELLLFNATFSGVVKTSGVLFMLELVEPDAAVQKKLEIREPGFYQNSPT